MVGNRQLDRAYEHHGDGAQSDQPFLSLHIDESVAWRASDKVIWYVAVVGNRSILVQLISAIYRLVLSIPQMEVALTREQVGHTAGDDPFLTAV